MARLPVPGSDRNEWGEILNEYLSQVHNTDGSLKAGSVRTATIADASVTNAKLSGSVQTTLAGAMTEIITSKQWIIAGPVNVAAGDVDYIGPAYLAIPAGATAVITGVRARINSGTNATLQINRNGSSMSGLTSVIATTSGTSITGLSLAVADGDLIAPVVNSTSGSPQNMTLEVIIRVTK
jgi:hypothetical protein